jgi:hypothetical protein
VLHGATTAVCQTAIDPCSRHQAKGNKSTAKQATSSNLTAALGSFQSQHHATTTPSDDPTSIIHVRQHDSAKQQLVTNTNTKAPAVR